MIKIVSWFLLDIKSSHTLDHVDDENVATELVGISINVYLKSLLHSIPNTTQEHGFTSSFSSSQNNYTNHLHPDASTWDGGGSSSTGYMVHSFIGSPLRSVIQPSPPLTPHSWPSLTPCLVWMRIVSHRPLPTPKLSIPTASSPRQSRWRYQRSSPRTGTGTGREFPPPKYTGGRRWRWDRGVPQGRCNQSRHQSRGRWRRPKRRRCQSTESRRCTGWRPIVRNRSHPQTGQPARPGNRPDPGSASAGRWQEGPSRGDPPLGWNWNVVGWRWIAYCILLWR